MIVSFFKILYTDLNLHIKASVQFFPVTGTIESQIDFYDVFRIRFHNIGTHTKYVTKYRGFTKVNKELGMIQKKKIPPKNENQKEKLNWKEKKMKNKTKYYILKVN